MSVGFCEFYGFDIRIHDTSSISSQYELKNSLCNIAYKMFACRKNNELSCITLHVMGIDGKIIFHPLKTIRFITSLVLSTRKLANIN